LLALVAGACSSDDDDSTPTSGDRPDDEAPPRGEDVASPTVTGPVTGGKYGVPFNPLPPDLADRYDYVEEEYFLEGTATSYEAEGTWETDGAWTAKPGPTAPYTTRIVVRRPADADNFNGSVLVEWLNVTAGMDSDPDFGFTHDVLLKDGWAYVGVSAQKVGVAGGAGLTIDIPGFSPQPLQEWDPERYGPLNHPGDAYSYDIFSQVAQALRRPDDSGVDVLDGLRPTTVLAAGESQSAIRMTTYVNAIHPLADIYDGFLIHSRGNGGAPLSDENVVVGLPTVHIRTDLDDPVLQFETESDLFLLGFYGARQADTDGIRTWEVAGTAHADASTVAYGIESGRVWNTADDPDFSSTCGRLNEGQQGQVLRRAVADLRTWAIDGTPPAQSPRIEVEADTTVVRDEHGNALGGIRTPAVDVPTATLTGERPGETNVFCSLFGKTTAFDAATLASLYPDHDDYVGKVTAAADAAEQAGFLLEDDAAAIVDAAEGAAIPS
jgi:hypothetical protein